MPLYDENLISFLFKRRAGGIFTPRKVTSSATPSVNLNIINAWKNVGNGSSSISALVSPTSGNCLVIGVAEYNASADDAVISDNIDGTTGWVKAVRAANGVGSVSLWYKKNIPNGITNITLNVSSGSEYYNIHAHEIVGASLSSPFTIGESSFSTGASTLANCGTLVTATADSIIISIVTPADEGVNPATINLNASGTSGGTWNHYNSSAKEDNGALNLVSSNPTAIVSTAGAKIHYWSFSGSRTWVAASIAIHN